MIKLNWSERQIYAESTSFLAIQNQFFFDKPAPNFCLQKSNRNHHQKLTDELRNVLYVVTQGRIYC